MLLWKTATTTKYYDGHDPAVLKNDYFGILEEIINFHNNQVMLFKYLWCEIDSGRTAKSMKISLHEALSISIALSNSPCLLELHG